MLSELQKRNQDIIEQTRALEKLTDKDIEMLKGNSRKLGSAICAILRHDPSVIGVKMEPKGGWVVVDDLIKKFNDHNKKNRIYLSLPILMQIVSEDNKKRYGLKVDERGLMISDDGMRTNHTLKIRCNQGHSIPWVVMDFKVETPPEVLYHGTSSGYLNSIMKEGLRPMSRQKVHLSIDYETAVKVGSRKGKDGALIVFQVDAKQMAEDGIIFYRSENDIWMADLVLPQYLHIMTNPTMV